MADKKVDLSHFDEAVKKYDLSSFDQDVPNQLVSELKSPLLGAAQGATLGFADEIESGVRSVLPESVGGGEYDKLIQDVRNRYKTAESEDPMGYLIGEVGGSLAVPLPGLGAVKGATGLAHALPLLKAGATAGAVASLGTREDDKLSLDAAKEALVGGAIGGGLTVGLGSALPSGLKFATKGLKESQIAEDVAEVYNKIKSGKVKTFDKKALPEFKDAVEAAVNKDILGNLDKLKEHSNASYENISNIAKSSDVEIPVAGKIAELRAKMPTEQQGVFAKDLTPIEANFGSLLGEQQVVKEVPATLNPEVAKEKVFQSLQSKAAAGEAKAEREYARKYLQSKLRNEMGSVLKGAELDSAVKSEASKLTSADIDDAVEEIRKLGLRERTQFPPEFEINPETGLEVGVVKRADADLTQAVPNSKLEKIKEIVATKDTASAEELMGYIKNIGDLATDKLKTDNPALFKYIVDTKATLENTLKAHMPKEYSTAKDMADALYRDTQIEAPAQYLNLPRNRGTSYEGRSNLGDAQASLNRMVGNFWEKPTDDSRKLQKFLDKLSGSNAEEIGLASSGKQGPATIPEIEANLQDVSRNLNLAERTSGVSALQGATPNLATPQGIVKKLTNFGMSSAAAKTLQVAEYGGNVAKEFNAGLKFMHTNTPESILSIASKVSDSKLANILKQAATAPDAKRKAIIFSLMQQPSYRDAIKSVAGDE